MLHTTRSILWLALLLAAALAGCHDNQPQPNPTRGSAATSQSAANATANKQPGKAPLPRSIGSATMKKDGTILLQLRATGEGGVVGDALFTYKKGHHRYQKIIERVGGLEPGQSKPVPPWPDK